MNYSQQIKSEAAFLGGGFMPSQSTQTTDNNTSSSSKNRENQGLLPLTAKQIIDAYALDPSADTLMVDGVEVNTITMLGRVVGKVDTTTVVKFILDDGTGKIECQRWAQDDIDKQEIDEIQDGMYVRIHGHLKSFHGKKQLVVFSVRPVTDFNEVAYHFVECIYVHVYNTKKQGLQGSGQTQPYMSQAMGMNGSARTQAPVSNQYSEDRRADPSVQGLDRRVLEYLCTPLIMGSEGGASLASIGSALKVSRNQIRESIIKLEGEGSVYSTVDEEHYKSALNG